MAQATDQEGTGRTAQIHSLCRFRAQQTAQEIWLSIRVDNLSDITIAYGEEVRRHALVAVRGLLADWLRVDVDSLATVDAQGFVEGLIFDPQAVFGTGAGRGGQASAIDAFCEAVACTPVATGFGPVHLRVSAIWGRVDDALEGRLHPILFDQASLAGDVFGLPLDRRELWVERYRADMARVASLLALMDDDAAHSDGADMLCLAWQPVCAAADGLSLLYREALLRLLDRNGQSRSLGDAVLACERLGFARYLDRYVVRLVLSDIERSADVMLGFNISAQSARLDPWWEAIMAHLAQRPEVARRLVVEITETAAIPDIEQAVKFASRLRGLGCLVAIDDFGTGYTSVRHMMALSPSLIKIDAQFLRCAVQCERAAATFRHLIGLAGSLCNAVLIVEGVETVDHARIAIEAGVQWHQGYFYSRPSLSRPWLFPAFRASDLPSNSGQDLAGGAQ